MPATPRLEDNSAFETEAERFACFAARLLADGRGENINVLDVRGLCQVTDFLVIGSGTSERMLRSSVAELKDLAHQEGRSIFRSDGAGDSEWVVVDMFDIVVHMLTPPQRAYYDIDSLWGDAKRIDWQTRTTPGQFARLGSTPRD